MNYGSVCSGIEAASVAWEPLGWRASFYSEIEPFPRSVLAHRFPSVPLHGDFTTIQRGQYADIDLLVGGTPCQAFSVAGLRGGMADARGGLALEYLRLAQRLRPRWLVWENVPGVLSSAGGRDFGAFLGGLVELGYGFAYRVLDAQYFGVAQRRRRVFVVGCLGGWQRAAAVLFERASLSGHPPPSRETGQDPARCLTTSSGTRGDYETEQFIPTLSSALRGKGHDAGQDGTGRRALIAVHARQDPQVEYDMTPALGAKDRGHAIALSMRGRDGGATLEPSGPVACALRASSGGGDKAMVLAPVSQTLTTRTGQGTSDLIGDGGLIPVFGWAGDITPKHASDMSPTLRAKQGGEGAGVAYFSTVRRLTPRECERLQGFPDDWTDVPHRNRPAADGPRYKAIGNSMAVPVMAWIGRRIQAVEDMR